MGADTSFFRLKWSRVPVKQLALLAVMGQNCALGLLLRYSRVMPLVNGHRYYASTVIFLAEVVKFSFFLSMALYEIATSPHTPETSTVSELAGSLSRAVFTGDSWKMALPAMLYTLQNSLNYVAASHLDAPTMSVTYQLKIVTTAVFATTIAGRALNLQKWSSLSVLALGVMFAQISSFSSHGHVLSIHDLKTGVSFRPKRSVWDLQAVGNAAAGQLTKRSATYEGIAEDVAAANPQFNASYGLAAALMACILSGLAGIYFEKILKTKGEQKASVWIRNVQLSFYSLWPALFIGVLFKDGEHLARSGFFSGYNWVVFAVIVLQAVGGILVALAITFADSMAKNLATSVSVFMIYVISVLLFEFETSVLYLFGTAVTLVAAYAFWATPDEKPRLPPINVTFYEKSSEAGYFDIESVGSATKSPLREPFREALSTSRPGTPTYERRPARSKREH